MGFRNGRWKSAVSWMLIAAMLGGYGNTAMAAGVTTSGNEGIEYIQGETEEAGTEETVPGGAETVAPGGESDPEEPEIPGSGEEPGTEEEKPSEGETDPKEDTDPSAGEEPSENTDSEEPVPDEALLTSQPERAYQPHWPDSNFTNLVVFVDFADTTHNHPDSIYPDAECFKKNPETTFRYFNGDDQNYKGMRQYLYNISYGQLQVENVFPQYDQESNTITAYTLSQSGAYYKDHESEMIREIIGKLNGQLPQGLTLDMQDGDGILDNLTVVVPCDSENKTTLFVGHKTDYKGNEQLGGTLVRSYNVLTEEDIYFGQLKSGVIIHEFLHTMGYPDLYRSVKNVEVGKNIPVSLWDIMATDNHRVQYPLAYLRSAITGWFEIPALTESRQGLSLYAASRATKETKDQQALILKTDYSDSEFFVVEYRRKGSSGEYEENIPGSGLIVYRVDTNYATNITGPPDFIYVFRPGDKFGSHGYEEAGGDYYNSYLSQDSGRTSYGSSDPKASLFEGALTYSDGTNSGIEITNVGNAGGDEITFDVTFHDLAAGEAWKTVAREEAGAGTSSSAYCMGADGRLYALLKKGTASSSPAALYECKEGKFVKLGDAPAGYEHQLAEYGGSLYAAYFNSTFKACLARWNGSSWQELYVALRTGNELSLASDNRGVYLAYQYAEGMNTQIFAVGYTEAGISDLGSQVSSSDKGAANPSIAAENGNVAVTYRESMNGNRICVKQYHSGSNSWEDAGNLSLKADLNALSKVKINNNKIYLMTYLSQIGRKEAYVYVFDMAGGSSWEQVGENAYSEAGLGNMELCFDGDAPYVAYISASSPAELEVKQLQNNQWTNLGATVAREDMDNLHIFAYGGQIYAAYRSTGNSYAAVRSHGSGREEESEKPAYDGTILEDENGKWLIVSEEEAEEKLTEEKILEIFTKHGGDAPFNGIRIVRTDACGELDWEMEQEVINGAASVLTGEKQLEFWFLEAGTGKSVQWEFKNPGMAKRNFHGNIAAEKTQQGVWSLTLSDSGFPAKLIRASYAGTGLSDTYTEGQEVFYYRTAENGERTLCQEGVYGKSGERPALWLEDVNGLEADVPYTAEICRLDWRLECVAPLASTGEITEGRISYYPSQEELMEALDSENLESGSCVRICCLGEGQPEKIPKRIFEICAGKDLELSYTRREEKTDFSYTWNFRGLLSAEEGKWEDFDLSADLTMSDAELPVEFLERTYIQVTPRGKRPACESVSLKLEQEGIALRFGDAESLSLWQREGDKLVYLRKAELDTKEGGWVSFALNEPSSDFGEVTYLLSSQSLYGWQMVQDENEEWHTVYIESRSGRAVTGWQIVNGRKCYFDGNGYLGEGPLKVSGVWYLFGSYADGTQGVQTGYQNGYYANGNGVLQKGWQKINNVWHYFSPEEISYGEELPSSQMGYWVTMLEGSGPMEGRRYYFRNNTTLLKNWQTVDGKRYFFMPEGYARTGWYPNESAKNAYYFNALGQMQTGYVEIAEENSEKKDVRHYFFNNSGVRQYGWQRILIKGVYTWHYFNGDASSKTYAYGEEIESEHTGGYWYVMEGNTYYFVNNGKLASGWQAIGGKRYYFDSQGKMYTDTRKIGNAYYHFRTDGEMEGVLGTGLFVDGGKTYYANSSGVLQRGWQKIEGIWRFFNHNTGAEEKGSVETNYWAAVFNENGEISKISYFINGTKIATGWQTIEGRRYYFDGNGILQTGFFKVGNNTYYGREAKELSDHPGEAAVGQRVIGNETYYFGSNYVMYVGWQKLGGVWRYFSTDAASPARGREMEISGPEAEGSWYWYVADGARYCFRSNTTLLKGWQTINGKRYYLNPSTGAAAAGITLKIGNYIYCFDEKGVMQKNTVVDGYGYNTNGCRVTGWQKLNNSWHYFDPAKGKEPDTWKEIPSEQKGYWVTLDFGGSRGKETYYFRNNASLVKNWQTVDGKRYYFDPKTGVLRTGNEEGLFFLGANAYYLGTDGALRYGWIQAGDGRNYYANGSGILLTGWQKIENLWYYFDRSTRQQDVKARVEDNYFATATDGGILYTYYFLNGTGLAKGWQTIEGRRYYFHTSTCQLQTGFFQVGKAWYYYNQDRTVKTGWWNREETGARYYFNGNGQAVTGWQTIGGSRYYFDANGVMQTQRTKIGNVYYFFGPDGKMRTGFVKYCDTTYYFNGNGQMLKGWQTIGGQRYYFDGEGALQIGFVKVGTATYYFDERQATLGRLLKGLQNIGEETYYFNTSGVLLKGWQKVGNVWRFFDLLTGAELETETQSTYWTTIRMPDGRTERSYINNGTTVLKGWQTIAGKRYYFDGNGFQWTEKKGWLVIGANRFYFNGKENDSVWQGFLELTDAGGKAETYYLNGNGQMLKGWQTIKTGTASGRYYLDPSTGTAWMGHKKIGNYWYYFDPANNGKMAAGYVEDQVGQGYYYNGSGIRQTGWQKIGNEWRYFDPGTGVRCNVTVEEDYWATVTLPSGKQERAFIKNGTTILKGWQVINGQRYYFDGNGFQWTEGKGWLTIGNNRFYFSAAKNNSVHQGFLELADAEGKPHTYYLNGNGQVLKGWQTIKVSGVNGRYYLNPSDGEVFMGHRKVGNAWYYFSPENFGKMATGYITDTKGDSYYYNTSGVLITGWQKLKGQQDYKYFDGAGDGNGQRIGVERTLKEKQVQSVTAGRKTTTYHWYEIADPASGVHGKRFCFLNNATLLKNRQAIGGKYYWFHGSTGALYTGYFAIGQNRYYSNEDGSAYTGFDPVDPASEGVVCYYNAYGQRVAGWQTIKDASGAAAKYYFNANGIMLKGICWIGNTRYVFHPQNGKLITSSVEIEGKTYYANTNGTLRIGWNRFLENKVYVWRCLSAATGEYLQTEPDTAMPSVSRYTWYRVTENGVSDTYCIYNNASLLKNYQNIGGKRYYLDASTGKLKKGWFQSGAGRCYSDPETGIITAGFQTLADASGKSATYYLNANGMPLKGWQKIGGKFYYFNGSGQMQTGFQVLSGITYYLNEAGMRMTGNIIIDDSEYYFNGNGAMQKGWFRFTENRAYVWKYFGADGKRILPDRETNSTPQGETNGNYKWYQVEEEWYCIYRNASVQKGFCNIGNWRYYFDSRTGLLQKGAFAVGTVQYYSDPETGAINRAGLLLQAEEDKEGLLYYDGNGKRFAGWISLKLEGITRRYYFQPGNGKAASGFTRIGNYYYYFDPETKALQKNASAVIEGTNTAGESVSYYTGRYEYLLSGWQKVGGVWHYFDGATKESVPLEIKENWITLNGNTYYFLKGTTMAKGWQTISVDGVNGRYYFNTGGILQKGWFNIGANRYYVNEKTGKAEAGQKTFEEGAFKGNTYYFDGNGLMKKGWVTISGKKYYFNANGIMRKGICWIGNARYVLEPITGEMITASVVIDGETYYANTNGTLKTGWQKVYTNAKRTAYVTYYYGTDGRKYTGWQQIGGKWYYLNADGILQTGLCREIPVRGKDGEKDTYYFNSSGVLQNGWFRFTENRKYVWRYFGADGRELPYEPVKGDSANLTPKGEKNNAYQWYQVEEPGANGKTAENWYCIYNNATVLKNFYNIGKWRYYFDPKTGVLQKGDFAVGAIWYRSEPETGAIHRSGLLQRNEKGQLCYYDGNGKRFSGWINLKSGTVTNRYYFQPDGAACAGFSKIGNNYYYFDPETSILRKNAADRMEGINAQGESVFYYTGRYEYLLSGWQKIKGSWYYFDGVTKEGSVPEQTDNNWVTLNGRQYYFLKGTTLAKGWQTIKVDNVNGRYYFDGNGVLQKGLFSVGVNQYYTNPNTGRAEAGFQIFENKTYYFDANGLMKKNCWVSVKNPETGITDTYYLNGNGELLKGICWIGNVRYLLNPETGARVTTSLTIEGKTYYADAKGALLLGWQKVYTNAKRTAYQMYYYGNDGQRVYGWQLIGGNTYYFGENGVMRTGYQGTLPVPGDGEQQTTGAYYFNGSGVMQKGWFRFTENKKYVWRFFGADGQELSYAPIKDTANLSPKDEKNNAYQWYRVEEKNGADGKTVENWYCIYNNAAVLKNFYNIGKWRYYFDSKTGALQKGDFAVGSIWYHSEPETGAINRSGLMYTDEETGERYYYDGNGKRFTGWLTIKSGVHAGKYYFNTLTGAAYRGGWFYVDNVRYLFDVEGKVREVPAIASLTTNNYRTVTVTWKPIANAKRYILEYAKDAAFEKAETEVAEGNEKVSLEVRNLQEGTKYYFRVKYVLQSKKEGGEEESAYSAVKNIVVQSEVAATASSATFQSFSLALVETEAGGEETGIRGEFTVKGRLKSYGGDASYYLVRVDSYSNKVLSKEPLYEIPKDSGDQIGNNFKFSFEIPLPREYENDKDMQAQAVMSKYALAVKSAASGYSVISKGMYVSNPEFIAEYQTPYFEAASKKGIQGALAVYSKDLGTKQTLMNLDLKSVLKNGPGAGVITYQYKGKTYYFSDMAAERGAVRAYIDGSYGNKMSVTMVLLASYRTDYRKELVHPSARKSGYTYYTLNSSTQSGQELYEAMFSYLGEVFGKDDCYVSNWVLGNEINSCNAWNYKGSLSFNEYMRCYAASFRQLYYGVKSSRSSSRVFISLDNAWNRAVAGYTGKSVLDTFASYIYVEDPNIEWNVAFHPYSSPLTRIDFWNDYSNTTNSVGSPFISMRNLDQLTGYLSTMETKYKKDNGGIRVILSEQGWTSVGNNGEYMQAMAIARAYYTAEFNPRVDAFIIRAEIDDWQEMRSGLYLGLKNFGTETKKTSSFVYKFMDTPVISKYDENGEILKDANNNPQGALKDYKAAELSMDERNISRFKDAQKIICNTNWKSMIRGYDGEKLNGMPYSYMKTYF